MSSMRLGPSTAIFILFFGMALYEAIARRSWLFALAFLVVAVISLRADAIKRRP